MKRLPTTISNILNHPLTALIIIGALVFYFVTQNKNNDLKEFEKAKQAELQKLSAKQDSILLRIEQTDKMLQDLAKQRDTLYKANAQLLQRQTSILNNIKNLQNEYSKIDKLNLDRAAIYRFYIDSCKTYIPY
jgi:HD superfamily phosphohydrolase